MDNPQIVRAIGRAERIEQIAKLVTERRDHSAFTYNAQRIKFPGYYNLYRGTVTTKAAPFKNNVFIPMIFSTIQSDVARKTQTSFGMYPYVTFLGNSPEDAIIARKREALVNSQLKDLGIFKKMYDLFLTADLYGTAIIQYGWRHEEADILMTEYEFLPITGTLEPVMNKRRITTFDGPDFKVLDPLDCFPQPGIRDIEDMEWFITQDYMDFEKVKRLGVIKEDGRSLFDAAEIRRMEEEGTWSEQTADDYKDYRSWGRTVSEFDARNREKYARPVRLHTQFGHVPPEMAPDGITNRIITVANDRYVLRNRPLPFWNTKKPIRKYCPMRDAHFFWSPGKAEIAEKLQYTANRFTNQQLDALDLFIDPMFIVNTDSGLSSDTIFSRPGKVIGVDGPLADVIQAVVPNLSGIQMGTQMTEFLWRWGQQGLGIIEDTVMGGAGQRQTAREYLGRSEAVATRLLLESKLFEEDFFEPLVDDLVDLNRQFLTLPKEVFILGKNAVIDPVTGLEIPISARQSMTGFDLVPNYDSRAVGATNQTSRSEAQQALTFLMQAASQNPIIASAVNWLTFFRTIFQTFRLPNIDELVHSPAEQEKMMIQMQRMSTPPDEQASEVPGTPNQPMNTAPPNMVGQGVM